MQSLFFEEEVFVGPQAQTDEQIDDHVYRYRNFIGASLFAFPLYGKHTPACVGYEAEDTVDLRNDCRRDYTGCHQQFQRSNSRRAVAG